MKTPNETPKLFTLMASMTAEARQRLGERRRELKKREGVVEELLEMQGAWKLVYKMGKKTVEEIDLSAKTAG